MLSVTAGEIQTLTKNIDRSSTFLYFKTKQWST